MWRFVFLTFPLMANADINLVPSTRCLKFYPKRELLAMLTAKDVDNQRLMYIQAQYILSYALPL